jgi:hypothetical protein
MKLSWEPQTEFASQWENQMNIFFTNLDPIKSAQNVDIRRLAKACADGIALCDYAIASHRGKMRVTQTDIPAVLADWAIWPSSLDWLWVYSMTLLMRRRRLGWITTGSEAYIDELQKRAPILDYTQSVFNLKSRPVTPMPNLARNGDLRLDFTSMEVTEGYQAYMTHRWLLDVKAGFVPKWGKVAAKPHPTAGTLIINDPADLLVPDWIKSKQPTLFAHLCNCYAADDVLPPAPAMFLDAGINPPKVPVVVHRRHIMQT